MGTAGRAHSNWHEQAGPNRVILDVISLEAATGRAGHTKRGGRRQQNNPLRKVGTRNDLLTPKTGPSSDFGLWRWRSIAGIRCCRGRSLQCIRSDSCKGTRLNRATLADWARRLAVVVARPKLLPRQRMSQVRRRPRYIPATQQPLQRLRSDVESAP